MRPRQLSFGLGAAVIAAFIAQPLIDGLAQGKKNTLSWAKPVVITRVKKPNRESIKAVPKTEQASLLTLQWNLIERGDGNVPLPVNPAKTFRTETDQVKFAITTNQDGYLYIINQPEGKDGVVIFPDLRIQNGNNRVLKNRQYLIPPSYCKDIPDPNDCWLTLYPPAGRELFLVIFSRDKITTLPNDISKAGEIVSRDVISQVIDNTEQKTEKVTGDLEIPGKGKARFATRVQNTNRKDNEEIIAVIEINHVE